MSEAVQTTEQTNQAPPAPSSTDMEMRFTPEQRTAFKRGDLPNVEPVKPVEQRTEQTTEPVRQEIEAPPGEFDPAEVKVDEKGVARNKSGQFVKSVPYNRFSEVLAQKKDLESRYLRSMEDAARADERLKIIADPSEAATRADATQAAAPPDPEKDVFGYLKWQQDKIAALEKQLNTSTSETKATLGERDAQTAYEHDVQRIVRAKPEEGGRPDYGDAYKHLLQQRARQLVLGNPGAFVNADGQTLNEKAIREQLAIEERDLRDNALRSNRSPAEVVYQYAMSYGYKPAAATTTQTTDNKTSAALQEIEAINKGAGASASMRGSGASATVGEQLTRSKLSNMNPGEFSAARTAYIAKNGKAAWLNLVG